MAATWCSTGVPPTASACAGGCASGDTASAPKPHVCRSITAAGARASPPSAPTPRRAHSAKSSLQHTTPPPGAADATTGTTAWSSWYVVGGASSQATRARSRGASKARRASSAATPAATAAAPAYLDAKSAEQPASAPARRSGTASPSMARRFASARSAGVPRSSAGPGVALAGSSARCVEGGTASANDAGTNQNPSGLGSRGGTLRAEEPDGAAPGGGGAAGLIHCTMFSRPCTCASCSASWRATPAPATASAAATGSGASMRTRRLLGTGPVSPARPATVSPPAPPPSSFPDAGSEALGLRRRVRRARLMALPSPPKGHRDRPVPGRRRTRAPDRARAPPADPDAAVWPADQPNAAAAHQLSPRLSVSAPARYRSCARSAVTRHHSEFAALLTSRSSPSSSAAKISSASGEAPRAFGFVVFVVFVFSSPRLRVDGGNSHRARRRPDGCGLVPTDVVGESSRNAPSSFPSPSSSSSAARSGLGASLATRAPSSSASTSRERGP